MKKLILIRHAKSSHEPGVSDFNRLITDSGASDARLVALNSSSELSGDFTIWCSPAKRALQTAAEFSVVYPGNFARIDYNEELYTFSSHELEQAIRACEDSVQTLIVFGHNEAITDFVNKFGDIYIDNVPTSGLVPITFDSNSWKNFCPGVTGRCVFPKHLRK